MPLNETELLERDTKRNIGEELLTAIRDVKSGHHGAIYAIEPNEIVATRVK
ncbi:MAG: transcriptional regulator, partial [Methylomonas sp.]